MTIDFSCLGQLVIPMWVLITLGVPIGLTVYAIIGGLTLKLVRWLDWLTPSDTEAAIFVWPLIWSIGTATVIVTLPFWFIQWLGMIVAGLVCTRSARAKDAIGCGRRSCQTTLSSYAESDSNHLPGRFQGGELDA